MNVSPRALVVIVAANVGGVPIAMRALLLVLLGHHNTGSYAVAGAGTATGAVGLAVTAPLFGRLLGRRGHRLVLLVTGGVSALGQLALVVATQPVAFVALAAVVGVSSPPILSSGRALLPDLVRPEWLSRAYTTNAIAQELVYVGGPLWISLWLVLVGPPGAVLACAAVGTIALGIAVAAIPPSVRAPVGSASLFTLRGPTVWTLVWVHVAYMASIGAIWVLIPAFATDAGQPDHTALLVTAWALGSIAGGVTVAVRGRRQPLATVYLTLLALLTVTALPLALAATVPQLAVAVAVFGLGLSPWLAAADELVARTAPTGNAGEAFGWLVTAGQVGSATGSVLAGAVADRHATGWPFLIVAGALVAALTVAVLRRDSLRALPSDRSGTVR